MMLKPASRPWPGVLEPFWWAARALRKELVGFRFDYPIETVPAAGPKESLHYYVYSDRLFFDAMELDPRGIPRHCSRTLGSFYNPAYVAWYGLVSLERSLRGVDVEASGAFWRQAEWLVAHAVRRDDGAVVWPYPVDFQEGYCVLKAPWICAMAQGLAISVLVRGYRMTGHANLLDLCDAATRVFGKNLEDGGVRTLERGHVLYEEYPGYPLPRVLDGFLLSLLGLYDLAVQTGESRVSQLFAAGIDGLRRTLEFWNYRNKWSWYGSHGYLCPPEYNKLNAALLRSLGRVSGDPTLDRYARAWDPERRTAAGAAEVFLVFLWTKNRSRLKHLSRLKYLGGRGPARGGQSRSLAPSNGTLVRSGDDPR